MDASRVDNPDDGTNDSLVDRANPPSFVDESQQLLRGERLPLQGAADITQAHQPPTATAFEMCLPRRVDEDESMIGQTTQVHFGAIL
jgi:hypothetical protein